MFFFSLGLYVCTQTKICIHLQSVCDGVIDCLSGEDEFGCDLMKCPKKCSCLNYAISCVEQKNISLPSYLPHTKLYIQNVGLVSFEAKSLEKIKFLVITQTSIKYICKDVLKDKSNIFDIEISYSLIRRIYNKCSTKMRSMVSLNVSGNRIFRVDCKAIDEDNVVLEIDLSHNEINSLELCTFSYLKMLQVLHLQKNPLFNIHPNSFNNLPNLTLINTNNFRICCMAQFLICNAKPVWPSSCTALLSVAALKVFTWLLSICIVIFNLTSIACCIFSILNGKKVSYMVLVLGINITDMMYGVYLITIAAVDVHYSGQYFIYDIKWQGSAACHAMATISLFSLLSACLILNLLTFSRLMVVKYPFESRFKRVKLPLQCLLGSLAVGLALSVLFQVTFVSTTGSRLPSPLCVLLGKETDAAILFVINTFLSLLQLGTIPTIFTMYVLLFQSLSTAVPGGQDNRQSLKGRQNARMLRKVIITGVSNILTWAPSSVIYLVSLGMTSYPVDMITWTIVLLNPVNSLVNPFILNITGAIHKFKKHFHPA